MSAESLQENYSGVFGTGVGFGKKPAVAMVDFINAYTTPESPLYAAPVVDTVRESLDLLDKAFC